MKIRENVELAPFTYYKIGGPARWLAQPESIEDLQVVAKFVREKNVPYFVLGAGSNVLFNDDGYDGLILQTSKLDRSLHHTISSSGEIEIEVGTSVMVIQLLRHGMLEGIAGLEFLVGIPGNLGGVFYMNAGTTIGDTAGAVTEVTTFDLESGTTRKISKEDLRYEYRTQHFLNKNEIILRGRLRGRSAPPKTVQDEVQALLNKRKASQPIDKPSCGSVFKNPDPARGVHAWKVIADCGLRGFRKGNAQISELHTNFIVNLGGARASDVKALIDEAKKRAREKFGIELHEEVKIVSAK
jgi:UDP-N-acetylmuramate dehydrogenase